VAAAVVVALVLVAPITALAVPGGGGGPDESVAQSAELVESCRTIDEPGSYELAGDLTASDTGDGDCIRIDASDVVLDGNGHTLAGENASGAGVVVFGGDVGTPVSDNPDPGNVTVRDLTAVNWTEGVVVGSLDEGGSDVEVVDVTVRENRESGVRLVESENLTVRNVTTAANGDGVMLWEVQNSVLRDVIATGNGDDGVALLEVSGQNTLRNVTATGNGADSERSTGVYLSTDTVDNVVVDAEVRDNRGTGVQFSDSFGNELRDSVVAGNDQAGVFGVPAYEDALRNVTVVGNGGPAVAHDHTGSQFVADDLRLGDAASVSFKAEPVGVQRVDAAELPEPPRPLASDQAVVLSDVEDGVTTSLSVENPAFSSLWRYGESGWQQVDDGQANPDAGTVSGTVTGDGSVVALADPESQDGQAGDEGAGSDEDGQSNADDENDSDGQNDSEGESSENDENAQDANVDQSDDTDGATDSVGDGTFVVQATTDGDFGYLFVVDGSAEGTETGSVAADSGDSVVDNGDGTVTVVGSTGSNAGDAFEVDGEVVEFYSPAPASEYVLELDDEDVTDEIPGPNENEDE